KGLLRTSKGGPSEAEADPRSTRRPAPSDRTPPGRQIKGLSRAVGLIAFEFGAAPAAAESQGQQGPSDALPQIIRIDVEMMDETRRTVESDPAADVCSTLCDPKVFLARYRLEIPGMRAAAGWRG